MLGSGAFFPRSQVVFLIMASNSSPQQASVRVVAYPPGWRWLSAALAAISRVSLVFIACMIVLGWFISPPLLVRLVFFLALVPGLAVMLLRAVFSAECEVAEGQLFIRRRPFGFRMRTTGAPVDVQAWRFWSLAAPGPGVSITFAQGDGVRCRALETRQFDGLISALAGSRSANVPRLERASRVYCRAKAESRLARWHWPWLKFGLFGLFPVFVVFRLHQNILFGGLFGQYYLQGPAPWLSSLAYHWIIVTVYLVIYAAFWRAWVELICWLTAGLMPVKADTVRFWGEILALLLYFAVIPGFFVYRTFY